MKGRGSDKFNSKVYNHDLVRILGLEILKRIPGYEPGKPPKPILDRSFLDELKATWGEEWGAQSAVGRLRKVLVHRPGDENKSPLIAADPAFFNLPEGLPNLEEMQREHDNLVEVLRSEGVDVIYLNPKEPLVGTYGIPLRSACFMHEAVVVKGGAIIERPAMAYKKGLEVFIAKKLIELGCPILYTVHGNGVFEASNLWFIDERTAIIATGLRTNIEGVKQVAYILRSVGVEEIHIAHLPGYLETRPTQVGGISGIFHLDMTFGMVDESLAVIYPAGVDYDTILFLKSKDINLIEIPEEELRKCAANVLPLAPGKVIIPAGNNETIRKLRQEGIDVIDVELSEFCKAGGGPRCLTLELIRD